MQHNAKIEFKKAFDKSVKKAYNKNVKKQFGCFATKTLFKKPSCAATQGGYLLLMETIIKKIIIRMIAMYSTITPPLRECRNSRHHFFTD